MEARTADVLLAAPGIAFESALVASAAQFGVIVQRRCVDAVELLAVAALHPAAAVVVSSALPRLSASVLEELQASGRGVVGLANDGPDRDRLLGLGLDEAVVVGSNASDTWTALKAVLVDVPSDPVPPSVTASDSSSGRITAVWGPMGAPGRTTIAIAIADSLSNSRRVLLVDADPYAPSIAAALGLIAPLADLGGLCRRAELSGLTGDELRSQCSWLAPRLAVVPGLRQRSRWPELRRLGLDRIWQAARGDFDHVVVDVGFSAEAAVAEWAPSRNAAALSALALADSVIAVGDGSAHGAARLADSWSELQAAAPQAALLVVHNRAEGRGRAWASAVRSLGVQAAVHCVPDDEAAATRSWRLGLLPGESARRSSIRAAAERIGVELVSH